jgi:chromosome segregation ATPase
MGRPDAQGHAAKRRVANPRIAEERRKDREEYRALWRDTQRQLNEVSVRLVQLNEADAEARAADKRLEARIKQLAAANEQLKDRIAALVSGFGEFIAKSGK